MKSQARCAKTTPKRGLGFKRKGYRFDHRPILRRSFIGRSPLAADFGADDLDIADQLVESLPLALRASPMPHLWLKSRLDRPLEERDPIFER